MMPLLIFLKKSGPKIFGWPLLEKNKNMPPY